ncbi:MAG: sensor histidine kinase [Stellaceae bacterium]
MRGYSLRQRLLAAMVLLFSLGVAASLVSYLGEVGRLSGNLWNDTLQEQAREFLYGLRMRADGTAQIDLSPAWQNAYADPRGDFAYTLFDAAGRPLAHSPNLTTPLPLIPVAQDKTFAPIVLAGVGPDQRAVVAAHTPEGGVLVVARRDIGREKLIDSLFQEASEELLVLLPFAAVALVLMWGITWWSLRPVTRASKEAAAVGAANPGGRISERGLPREVRPLVAAANGALDRLAEAYVAERRITADAAHALRTPLAVLSLRLQRARHRGTIDWPAVENEIAQMTAMVSQLLDLARKEAQPRGDDIAALPVVNLSRLIREAAAGVVPLMERQGRVLAIDVPEVVAVHGRADDLRDLVRNLLENALWHGRGTVRTGVRCDDLNRGRVMIDVADEGDGVPPGMEEEAFARFHKIYADSPGSGLGLAIVRHVARSHGGDARFVPGAGHVVVTLPTAGMESADAVVVDGASTPAPVDAP